LIVLLQGLDQCDKDILTTRLLTDANIMGDIDGELSLNQIRSVLADWKVLFYIFIYMGFIVSLFGFNSFLPIIINNMNYTERISFYS
jgi:hypothetical protein